MQALPTPREATTTIAPDAQALQDIFEEIALTLPVVFTD